MRLTNKEMIRVDNVRVIDCVASWREQQQQWQQQGLSVALVPTMGNLHSGHFALVKRAQQCADKVVVSIFVNPTQFSPNEDFTHYPRTLAQDVAALTELGVDAVFAPSVDQLYPEQPQLGLGINEHGFWVQPPMDLTQRLCGLHRPGHFTGVCTVVLKLLNIIQPKVAVFGQKDYQQLAIIRAMVHALQLPIDIQAVETQRQTNGLALSSRNQYLTDTQQQQAAAIYATLQHISIDLQQGKTATELIEQYTQTLLQQGFHSVDYIAIVHPHTLADISKLGSDGAAILIAAYLGKTRLIDNMLVKPVASV